jgi:hypothetical protein
MDTQKIHYCFILSDDQMEFLRSKKYKIDRMECFLSMATLAVRETKLELSARHTSEDLARPAYD